jgi:hypothetical protein
MADMKVMVYSNFSKKEIQKKMKFPSSMRNARFQPFKCRGKVQKMGVLFSQNAKPISKLPHKTNLFFLNQKNWKRGRGGREPAYNLLECRLQLLVGPTRVP